MLTRKDDGRTDGNTLASKDMVGCVIKIEDVGGKRIWCSLMSLRMCSDILFAQVDMCSQLTVARMYGTFEEPRDIHELSRSWFIGALSSVDNQFESSSTRSLAGALCRYWRSEVPASLLSLIQVVWDGSPWK